MGIQNQLNDVSSDSLPILLISIIINSISYLRSYLFTFLHLFGIHRFDEEESIDVHELAPYADFQEDLASQITLSELRNLNKIFSYRFGEEEKNDDADGERTGSVQISDCIVCLSALNGGEKVRRLECQHLFHKECLDGWLDHLNFNCPLCRSPLLQGMARG